MEPLAEDALIWGLLGLLPFLAEQALGKRRDGLLPNRTKPREKNSYSDGKLAAVGNALANGHCQGDIPPLSKNSPRYRLHPRSQKPKNAGNVRYSNMTFRVII